SHETELVVRIIKQGAVDFIAKPYSPERIEHAISQALEKRSLRNEIDYLRRQQNIVYDFDRILAVSPVMKKVLTTVRKLADNNSTILMTGETGTGKSFLAGTIHYNSPRRHKPFVMINCANIPETLLESELFGHERGAFTGALKTRAGRFEQANEGTVFLDEIGELSPALQAKLLRVLEEKAFERVGGNQTIHSDIRIIAATNRILEQQVADGAFREDLYYRLNVVTIYLPPLRERREDIPELISHFLNAYNEANDRYVVHIETKAMEAMQKYHWPGNVRELENIIERATALAKEERIESDDLPPDLKDFNAFTFHRKTGRLKTLEEIEQEYIQWVLEQV
ncbi:MAG TPA: sigma-54-dependent Fis family transcriptional regulator, partial [Syntrophobacteraceae bacterium]|nr:sigma-54-dependent Fis family transcriptional regulator [Syntrophobacteraceae bacterium]